MRDRGQGMRAGRRTPWRAWLVMVAAVVALHALVLSSATGAVMPAVDGSRDLHLQWVYTVPPIEASEPPEPPTARSPLPTVPASVTSQSGASPSARDTLPPAPDAGPAPKPDVLAEAPTAPIPSTAAQALVGSSAAASVAAALAKPAEPGASWPVYATRVPPSFHWSYRLKKGMLSGRAKLLWRVTPGHYEARLTGSALGFTLIDQVSTGLLDSAGIAPVRYVVRQRGKDHLAANFQRDVGKLTYSGPTTEITIAPAMQDRVTWMMQLAAVAAADPARVQSGARTTLWVTGARADTGLWAFVSKGPEVVETPTGPSTTVRLLRETEDAHDLRVEVWLDPRRHHMPVRARMTSVPDGDTLDMVLDEELSLEK